MHYFACGHKTCQFSNAPPRVYQRYACHFEVFVVTSSHSIWQQKQWRSRQTLCCYFGFVRWHGFGQRYLRLRRRRLVRSGSISLNSVSRKISGLWKAAKGLKARCCQCRLLHCLHRVALKINQLSHAMSVPFGRRTCSVFP